MRHFFRAVKLSSLALLLVGYILFVRYLKDGWLPANQVTDLSLTLGFLLLFSYLIGQLARICNAPMLTGYLVAGLLSGPYILNVVTTQSVLPLKFINLLALSLIALAAGGELQISKIRARIKCFGLTTIIMTLMVFIFSFTTFVTIFYLTKIVGDDLVTIISAAMLIAVVSAAISPASAIGVIAESKAKGKISDTIISVAILSDIAAIFLFAIIVSITKQLLQLEIESSLIMGLLYELGGSIVAGLIFGLIVILFLKKIHFNLPLILLGVAFIIVESSKFFHLSPLLMSVVVGFVVENFSKEGDKLIKFLKGGSLPVIMIFFSLAGQSFQLEALYNMWPYVLVYVLIRLIGIRFGSHLGVKLAGEPVEIAKLSFSGFISQAGVTLGFVAIISDQFGSIGSILGTIILGGVIVNQLAGPIVMKRSLILAKESSD
ncbi:MAG: cation:proton antiporter [Nitrospinota bacterium]